MNPAVNNPSPSSEPPPSPIFYDDPVWLKTFLASFCAAIRKKDNWFAKILDKERDLAGKWAQEARLNPSNVDVARYIQELKDEAKRIVSVDRTIVLTSRHLPSRPIDYEQISTSVRGASNVMRNAKYAVQQPVLRENVGVYVTDDLVPRSLHKELEAELKALAALTPKDFHPGTFGKVQDLIHPSLYPYQPGGTEVNPLTILPQTHPDPGPLPQGPFHRQWSQTTGEDSCSTVFLTSIHASGLNSDPVQLKSSYAWIPSIIRVSDDGLDAHIESYINGLGSRERFPELYRLIEKVFVLVLPQLEKTVSHQFKFVQSSSLDRWEAREALRHSQALSRVEWDAKLESQALEKAAQEAQKLQHSAEERHRYEVEKQNYPSFSTVDVGSTWKGKELKVIIKAADYVLRPGEEYDGSWHIEGMPHERIVASAIYYYSADQGIIDKGLGLRRIRDGIKDFPHLEDFHQDGFELDFSGDPNKHQGDDDDDKDEDEDEDEDDEDDLEKDVPSEWEETGDRPDTLKSSIYLGIVPTAGEGTGRILTFPNWLQHHVEGLSVENKDELDVSTRRRKILCFFLVNDDEIDEEHDSLEYPGFHYSGLKDLHVLSTREVPEQAAACNILTLRFLLTVGCERLTGKVFPAELVEMVLTKTGVNFGMSWEEAEKTRRQFMADRGSHGSTTDGFAENDDRYTLCEH